MLYKFLFSKSDVKTIIAHISESICVSMFIAKLRTYHPCIDMSRGAHIQSNSVLEGLIQAGFSTLQVNSFTWGPTTLCARNFCLVRHKTWLELGTLRLDRLDICASRYGLFGQEGVSKHSELPVNTLSRKTVAEFFFHTNKKK